MKSKKECRWKQQQNKGCGSDYWGTQCGDSLTLNSGIPSENNMKFCCYCGKKLAEELFKEEPNTE